MSARSEESLKKDDNGGESNSDGDLFDKIRSLFGDAICDALQSKLKFLYNRQACTPGERPGDELRVGRVFPSSVS